MSNLLPPNSSKLMLAIDKIFGERLDRLHIPIRDLWCPHTCPEPFLPHLAMAFGIDWWDDGWSEEAKRNTIANAFSTHKQMGTVGGVEQAIRDSGLGDSQLFEGNSSIFYNGALSHDGMTTHGDPTEWARYRLVLSRAISNTQATKVRNILKYVAPLTRHLVGLIYSQVAHLHNGEIFYDNNFNYGAG